MPALLAAKGDACRAPAAHDTRVTMPLESRDCVVIGGGPAGSTFASIVKKYSPALSVTVLEQASFPRYHIGESTIPVANSVFWDLGVYDDLLSSSFVKKMGIVFIWGRDRKPWTADYLRLRDVPMMGPQAAPNPLVAMGPQAAPNPWAPGAQGAQGSGADIIDVTGLNVRTLLEQAASKDVPFLGFNVQRAEFDKMLLDRSRRFGADVREGTRVTGILRDGRGAVTGVSWQDEAGKSGTIEAPIVLDASGLSSVLTRGQREYDPHMNNFAVYGYLSDAGWKVTYNGTRQRTSIFIAAVEKGWIWYFPIRDDIMSVGAVTRRDHFQDRLASVDLEDFWWEMLRSCPEVSELVKGATLRTDVLPGGKRVAASQDWSSWARSPVGDGWAAAGDAAVFVDPILSSGVTLALQSGYRAAFTYNTVRARPDIPAASLWRAYADYIRGEAGSFLTLARYFYGNNRAAESWWWESQRVVNRSGLLSLDDHQSFTMATAGFFPTPRTISPGVVGGLLTHLSGTRADLSNVFRDSGVPAADLLARCKLTVVTPFRLAVRAEPSIGSAHKGVLDVYHDLVTDDEGLAHRWAAAFCRLPPEMEPVVSAIPEHASVASLLDAAPSLVRAGSMPAEDIRRHTLDVLRVAALKGFVRLEPGA
jgi:flavin-dependent dehydrogenase